MEKIKQYSMRLLTLGPIHIGDGSVYLPKEYIYENNNYYFPEMDKVYSVIQKKGTRSVEAFENYLLTARTTDRLVNFLKRENITERNFGGYSIKATGYEKSKETKGHQLNKIRSFIKNPYKQPYIPGSSLKGAIRTILANVVFKTDNVDNATFNKIRVSDSEPVDLSNLIIVQKVDYSNPKKKLNEIPLYRESIKPLTMINFTITCEGKEAQELIENLGQYSNSHYEKYEEFFMAERPDRYIQSDFSKNIIYIGGGSGFWTKTIIEQARTPRGTPKMRMVGKGVHKLTRTKTESINRKNKPLPIIKNKEALYEMGKCLFQINKIRESES